MSTESSKCSAQYTNNCVGNEKAAHDRSPSPTIRIGHGGLAWCDAAASSFQLKGPAGTGFRVFTTDLIDVNQPVYVDFGALIMSLTEDQAIAFGDALIQAAHRRRAAIATAKAAQAQVEADIRDGTAEQEMPQ